MKLRNGLSAIVIAGVALASSTSQSQVTEAWFRSFDYQGGRDVAVDVATDVYGSLYVTGYGTNTAGNLDIVTLKICCALPVPLAQSRRPLSHA